MRSTSSKRLLAILLAFFMLAAACGDSDDDSTATTDGGSTGGTDQTNGDDGDNGDNGDGEAFQVNLDDCDDPDAAGAPIEGEIAIGSSVPLSGGPAVLFAPFGEGLKAYFDYYNDQGGLGGEQEVNLILKDDQYEEGQTVTNVGEILDNDDPAGFAGVIGTPNNLAVRDDLNDLCVPQLFNATGALEWGDVENYPWTMGGLVPYAVESRVFAEYAAGELPDGGTAGVFYVNTEFGEEYIGPFEEAAGDAGFEMVVEATISGEDGGAPSSQMTNIVDANPDILLAVPLGAQCIAFMQELGNAKAQNPDFDPMVYITGTCASTVFFGAAGEGADGVYTSSNFKNIADEQIQTDDPEVAEYIDQISSVGSDIDPAGLAAAGWSIGETMGHVLEQAAASSDGLTRGSIIEAARSLKDYQPGLLQEGLSFNTSATDAFIGEGTQIRQWNGSMFEDVGDIITLEGTTKFEG